MNNGAIIDYTIRWFGMPIRWRTRILSYRPPEMFVDEQLKGPYTLWHHTHTFMPTVRGTEMTDVVRYRLPAGVAGRMAHALLVRRQLEEIFDYRAKTIGRIFGPIGRQQETHDAVPAP
jgi:ligand-binding SRPBCC domain-containing protein